MQHTLTGRIRFGTVTIPHIFTQDEEYVCIEVEISVPDGPDDYNGMPSYLAHRRWIKATPLDLIKLTGTEVEWVYNG